MTESFEEMRSRIERESRRALDMQWACGLRDELWRWIPEPAQPFKQDQPARLVRAFSFEVP